LTQHFSIDLGGMPLICIVIVTTLMFFAFGLGKLAPTVGVGQALQSKRLDKDIEGLGLVEARIRRRSLPLL